MYYKLKSIVVFLKFISNLYISFECNEARHKIKPALQYLLKTKNESYNLRELKDLSKSLLYNFNMPHMLSLFSPIYLVDITVCQLVNLSNVFSSPVYFHIFSNF